MRNSRLAADFSTGLNTLWICLRRQLPSTVPAAGRSICSSGSWCCWRWRGIVLGYFAPDAGARMEPLGDAFIKAIRVLIAPIIFCTVVHGISGMASMAKVGRVALKALIYFEVADDDCARHRAPRRQFVPARRRHARRSFASSTHRPPRRTWNRRSGGAPCNFCSTSSPIPSSARLAKATSCRSFTYPCSADLR